jgi:hypothetical protein
MELVCHPAAPAKIPLVVHVNCTRASKGTLNLSYALEGTLSGIRIPEARAAGRADRLWQHTCFEVFLAVEGVSSYVEFNFAPSGAWAIYRFSGHRAGMVAVTPAKAPQITARKEQHRLTLEAVITLDEIFGAAVAGPMRMALAAVVEASDGSLSYWALRHAPGKPDFHHPGGFSMELP